MATPVSAADWLALFALAGSARINLRSQQPSIKAAIVGQKELGSTLTVRGIVKGDIVSGNAQWYAGEDDVYFWSGGCGNFRPAGAGDGLTLQVKRRPNGTVSPLTEKEVRTMFGDFKSTEGKKGAIAIEPAWVAQNIVSIATPLLTDVGRSSIECHVKAQGPFERVFKAIVDAGLEGKIRTCAGTFVPRHKGWNPARGLSVHSWGIAIDLNAEWNAYGAVPAALGAHGSTRELVSLFEAEGFAGGGYFEPLTICDGMHFELARLDV